MKNENSNIFEFHMPRPKEEKEIGVRKNQNFEIVIDGNITTGYNWTLSNADDNDLIVKPLNLSDKKTGDYHKGNHPPGWCGGSGTLHFKFEPVTVGTQQLKFIYNCAWNKDVSAELIVNAVVSDS